MDLAYRRTYVGWKGKLCERESLPMLMHLKSAA